MSEFSKHDIRILFAALLAWAVAALHLSSIIPNETILAIVGAFCCISAFFFTLSFAHPVCHAFQYIAQMGMLYACVILCVLCSCMVQDAWNRADIQSELSTVHKQTISARVQITSPLFASPLPGFTCSVEATAQELTVRGIAQGSRRTMRIFARSPTDCALERGASYVVHGAMQFSKKGRGAWVLHLDYAERLTPAPVFDRCVEYIHTRFLEQTSRLDTQGSLLVPGVTMGVMGHDVLNPSTAITSLPQGSEKTIYDTTRKAQSTDPAEYQDKGPTAEEKGSSEYPERSNHAARSARPVHPAHPDAREAKKIKKAFRVAGIMHVLAVSGGHFALAITTVTWIMKRIRAHRALRAAAMILADILLYILLYPSDSILRAGIMGLFSAGYVFFGRRADSSSALSWTILCVLMVDPEYALSVGFSLSCAAVYGIIFWSGWISSALEHFLPRRVAAACALTLAAHVVTLPISLLLSDSIPVYAIVANVLIAVPMDVATVCGLLGLALAWWAPPLAYICVWIAGKLTAVMVSCAYWVSSWPFAQVSVSMQQLAFAYALLITAVSVGVYIVKASARIQKYEREYRDPFKTRWGTWWTTWWKETLDMFR